MSVYDELAALGSATVHEAAGRTGVVDVPLIQVLPGSRAAGPARTVRCGQGDNLMVHAAMAATETGDVLVLTMPDPQPVASEDWLRDNYHVVQDQIREVRQDLPRKFYLELPKLAAGPFEGYPRVYLIDRLPVQIRFEELGLIAVSTLVICFGATIYPSVRASSIPPVEGLRYE